MTDLKLPPEVTPEVLADAIEVLEALGYITVDPDPDSGGHVLISAGPTLVRAIEEHGITPADFATHVDHTSRRPLPL